MKIVLETHSNFSPHPSCEYGNINSMGMLHSWLVDDLELADALANYGIPARYIDATVEYVAGLPTKHIWSWRSPDGPLSTLEFTATNSDARPTPVFTDRLVWWNSTAIGIADFEFHTSIPLLASYGVAEFGSDMLAPGLTINPSDLNTEMSATAPVVRFGGHVCEPDSQ